jgi:hypothetical protein
MTYKDIKINQAYYLADIALNNHKAHYFKSKNHYMHNEFTKAKREFNIAVFHLYRAYKIAKAYNCISTLNSIYELSY